MKTKNRETISSVLFSVMALCALSVTLVGSASAKSLYVNRDLNANSPIRAYDIQPAPNYLVYQMDSVPTRYGGAGLAIDTDSETLFVTFETSGTLDIVNARTLGILGQVSAPGASNLAGIVVDQHKQKVYAVDRNTRTLYVYSWHVSTKILVLDSIQTLSALSASGGHDSGAHGIALDEVNDLLYVCDVSTTVKIFNTADWSLSRSISVSQRAMGVAVDVANGLVYTGNAYPPYGSLGFLSKYDLNTSTETTVNIRSLTGSSSDNVVGLAVDPATGLVYITTGNQGSGGSDRVMVFDFNLNLLYQTGDIGDPTGLCVPGRQVSYNPLNLAKNDIIVGSGVYIGSQFTYEITCDNSSNPTQDATGVTLTDDLPAELDFVSATHSGVYQPSTHTVFWNIGTIPAGAAGPKIELVVRVNANAQPGQTIYNYCTIDADGIPPTTVIDQDPNDPNDEPGTLIVGGTVEVTVDAPDEATMGSKYRVDLSATTVGPWLGGDASLIIHETRGVVQADWDIHDNQYWDLSTWQWERRPESECDVYLWEIGAGWILEANDYQFGVDTIPVDLGTTGGRQYYVEGYHRWYWIPPWDLTRVLWIIAGIVDPYEVVVDAISLGMDLSDALGGQHQIAYTYNVACDGAERADTTTVKVPTDKYIWLGTSVGSNIAGIVASLIGGPIGWACEAVCIVATEATYVVASDPPDFNYAEVAFPQVPRIPELDQIADPCQREVAEKALEFGANIVALRTSLERYEAAKINGMPQYMALQMGAVQLYAEQVRQLATSLRDFWCPFSATLPIPTPEQIQQIRQDLLQKGLPDLEVSILSAFGYSSEEMNQVAQSLASLSDEWFTSPGTICDGLEIMVDGVSKYIQSVPSPQVKVIFPQLGQVLQDGVTFTAEVNDQNIVDAVYFYVGEPNNDSGIPTAYQELAATIDSNTGLWKYDLDTTQLADGYYVVLAKAVDTYGNVGWSQIVPFSIRNWAIIKLLPATPSSKAGRTMPVKFSIRIAQSVDPTMPFVYNDDLEIRIYKSTNPSVILQRSRFGTGSTDYRIDIAGEKYITNFKTSTTPATYVVEIWRPEKNFKVGSFTFKTVK